MCKCYGLVCLLQAARLFAVPWGRGTAVGGCLLAALVLFSGRGRVCGALPEELHPRQAELVGFLFACVLSRVRFGRDSVVVVFRGKGGEGGVLSSSDEVLFTGLSEGEAEFFWDVLAGKLGVFVEELCGSFAAGSGCFSRTVGRAFELSQKEVALRLLCGYNAPACRSMFFISLLPI